MQNVTGNNSAPTKQGDIIRSPETAKPLATPSLGDRVVRTLAERMGGCSVSGVAMPRFGGPLPCQDELNRLAAGDRDPELGPRLLQAVGRYKADRHLAVMIADEIKRPASPSRLSIRTAAYLTGISEGRLRQYVASGQLNEYRIGHRPFFDADELEGLLKQLYLASHDQPQSLLLEDKVFLDEAAKRAGVSQVKLRELTEEGCVSPLGRTVLKVELDRLRMTKLILERHASY
jgi:hypothetical protein